MNINNLDDKDGERVFHNPTYADTSAKQPLMITSNYAEVSELESPPTALAMYDSVKPLTQAMIENGPTYDILKRGQTKGIHI